MGRLVTWLPRIIVGLVVVAFVYAGLRGLVIELWRTPDLPQTYFVEGADGRAMAIVLMPDNYIYFSYTEPAPFYSEVALAETRGEYGTHYFWNIWSVDRNSGWFGMRALSDGQRPANIEATVIDKFVDADHNVTLPRDYFPSKGETSTFHILISDEAIEFEGSTLLKVPNDVMLLLWLEKQLPFPETPR